MPCSARRSFRQRIALITKAHSATEFTQGNTTVSRVTDMLRAHARSAHGWRRWIRATRICSTSPVDSALGWLLAATLLTATPAGATCNVQSPTRIALFGDLHVHTGLSFDAYISSIRLGPNDAYRYAKGEPLVLPGADGKPGTSRVSIDLWTLRR